MAGPRMSYGGCVAVAAVRRSPRRGETVTAVGCSAAVAAALTGRSGLAAAATAGAAAAGAEQWQAVRGFGRTVCDGYVGGRGRRGICHGSSSKARMPRRHGCLRTGTSWGRDACGCIACPLPWAHQGRTGARHPFPQADGSRPYTAPCRVANPSAHTTTHPPARAMGAPLGTHARARAALPTASPHASAPCSWARLPTRVIWLVRAPTRLVGNGHDYARSRRHGASPRGTCL